MDGHGLIGCLSGNPVATGVLSPKQLFDRTVNPDEEHRIRSEQLEAVAKTPRFTEDMIHDDVVSCLGHTGNRAMEAGARLGEHTFQLGRREFRRARFGTHRAERIDRHVKERCRKQLEKLSGDARLARARNAIEENDSTRSTRIGHTVSVRSDLRILPRPGVPE